MKERQLSIGIKEYQYLAALLLFVVSTYLAACTDSSNAVNYHSGNPSFNNWSSNPENPEVKKSIEAVTAGDQILLTNWGLVKYNAPRMPDNSETGLASYGQTKPGELVIASGETSRDSDYFWVKVQDAAGNSFWLSLKNLDSGKVYGVILTTGTALTDNKPVQNNEAASSFEQEFNTSPIQVGDLVEVVNDGLGMWMSSGSGWINIHHWVAGQQFEVTKIKNINGIDMACDSRGVCSATSGLSRVDN